MINDLNDLRLFVRMVSAGSLSETARRLNSSLPAVSRRLAGMEARLGAKLVDRGTRRFVPTEEGLLLFERGQSLLAELDQLEAQVSARTSSPFGHIRVAAPDEIGRRQIATIVAEFSRLYPHITVELLLTDHQLDLVGDEIDVGLHVDVPPDPGTIVRKLIGSRRILCASPDYVVRHGMPTRPEDLTEHRCLCLTRGRHIYDHWLLVRGEVRKDIRVAASLICSSGEVLHSWALAGYGIARKAGWDVEEDLADGRLVRLLPDYEAEEISLYVTYTSKRLMPKRVRVFIDHIVEKLASA
jgi:DNA-binding transcriptional LysR family regulator